MQSTGFPPQVSSPYKAYAPHDCFVEWKSRTKIQHNKTHDVQQMCIILLFSFPKFGLRQQGSLPYVRYGKLLKTHPDDRGLSPPMLTAPPAHAPPPSKAQR